MVLKGIVKNKEIKRRSYKRHNNIKDDYIFVRNIYRVSLVKREFSDVNILYKVQHLIKNLSLCQMKRNVCTFGRLVPTRVLSFYDVYTLESDLPRESREKKKRGIL